MGEEYHRMPPLPNFALKTHGQDHPINGNRAVTVCTPREGLFLPSAV